MKKILSLIMAVFLTGVALSAIGCSKAKYEHGYFTYDFFKPCSISLGVRSNKNIFSLDDISMDLYYGFYENSDYKERGKDYFKEEYSYGDNDVFIGIYTNKSDIETFYEPIIIEDGRNIANNYLIKEMAFDEAFSGKYGYDMKFLTGTRYNHYEKITIPQEVFDKERGRFEIAIALIALNDEGNYLFSQFDRLRISYEKLENGKLKINF